MSDAALDNRLFELEISPWFTAREVAHQGELYMVVYRSLLVKDSDKLFGPVADRLREAKLVLSQEVEDDDMIFGRALWQMYLLR